jgi:hypothetical protein
LKTTVTALLEAVEVPGRLQFVVDASLQPRVSGSAIQAAVPAASIVDLGSSRAVPDALLQPMYLEPMSGGFARLVLDANAATLSDADAARALGSSARCLVDIGMKPGSLFLDAALSSHYSLHVATETAALSSSSSSGGASMNYAMVRHGHAAAPEATAEPVHAASVVLDALEPLLAPV